MYLEYFGLERNPFSLTPDPRFLFMTAKHREALASLMFAVVERKGFLVMTGEAGTGKTTLIRKLLLSIPSTCAQFSMVIHPTLTISELLESVLMDFGVKEIPSSKAGRLYLLREMLIDTNRDGKTCVLVVDEAHLLSSESMQEIRLLSNFETNERKLLQIILAGQNELGGILNLESLSATRQRIALRMHLDPLDRNDVARYMRTRWTRASGKEPLPFGEDAIETISRFSRGIPRVINALCDSALTNAYGMGVQQIGSKQIMEVARDLQLVPVATGPIAPVASATPRMGVPPAPSPSAVAESAATAFKTLRRYMPEKAKHRRWPRVASWLHLARTEAE
jgi:general secretion pathway protein A